MQHFNLDRFKAGEPAYDKLANQEYFFLAEFPDGRIAIKYLDDDEWWCCTRTLQTMNDKYYMKAKELTWDEVSKMWSEIDDFDTFLKWLEENLEPPKLKNQ